MSTNSNNGPQVNVDGTPMVADSGVDIKGNPYGVTEPSIDTSCTAIDNSYDDTCSSSFDSYCDSNFDSFSSGFDDF
ncbi:hypothetical protein MSG37_10580 [Shewanella sp. 1CM18E]|uniref:hypothetical protein n=1 Tax=Shewanella sp. 1CM18E TaxID=2929169 RepID=UPI0020BD8E7B|nr:hypothetical protein [Shewanella sp. 1CM18E]MCK8045336.1 hypothetical protein [Shewanella sp. 1CM18E]